MPSREPQRKGRQQRYACCSERAGHGRERSDNEYAPRNQRPPRPDEARCPFDDAPDRTVVFRDGEQISNPRHQRQQFDGESAVYLLHVLAHEDRANEKRHRQGETPEVDGSQYAKKKDDDESDYSDDVNGQSSLRLAPELRRPRLNRFEDRKSVV